MEKREGINTILSVFEQQDGGRNHLDRLKPGLFKGIDLKQETIDEVKFRSPKTKVINRIFIDDNEVNEAIKADPEGTAEAHNALILGKGLSDVDYWQIQNEQLQRPSELTLLNRYYVRLINLAVAAGYKTTVIDCSVGNLHVGVDHPGDWPHVYPTLELAQIHGFPVNVHQYSRDYFWNDKRYPAGHPRAGEIVYNNDWYLHRLEHTAMKQLDAAGFTKLLYVVGEFGLTKLLAVAPDDRSFRGGWQLTRTHEEYKADLIRIMSYLLLWSDRIIGYCCYLTHANSDWATHEMSRMNEDLANHYAANPQTVKALGSGEEVRPILFQARVVNTSTLNVRSGPGAEHDVVGQITDQDIIDVYDASALWWEIKHGSLEGWSHSGYLERIEEETTLELRVSALENTVEIHTDAIARLEQVVAEQMVSIRMLDTRVTALESGGGNGGNGGGGERRFSEGADFMGLTVEPPSSGSIKYRLVDIFTTLNGSWEVGDQPAPYGIEQWARDAYLTSAFDDAGASTHLFAHILDQYGNIAAHREVKYWTPAYDGNDTIQLTKSHSGWANIALFPASSFSPENNERGVWAWGPPGGEIVMGGGLPNRHHVSTFAVWQEV